MQTNSKIDFKDKRYGIVSCIVFKVVTEVELDILLHYSSMPSLLVFRFCFKRHCSHHLRRQLFLNCNGIYRMFLFLFKSVVQYILVLLVTCTDGYSSM